MTSHTTIPSRRTSHARRRRELLTMILAGTSHGPVGELALERRRHEHATRHRRDHDGHLAGGAETR